MALKNRQELWQRYGHQPDHLWFLFSEEMGGSLDNWEKTEELQQFRKKEMIYFFKEFKSSLQSWLLHGLIMLATNSMEVPAGAERIS